MKHKENTNEQQQQKKRKEATELKYIELFAKRQRLIGRKKQPLSISFR